VTHPIAAEGGWSLSASRPPNLFFPLTVVFSGLFIVTILALVAGIFGDPQAPIARFLDRNGGMLLVAEVVAILVTGFLALATDRRQALADKSSSSLPRTLSAAPHDQQPQGGD